MILLIREESLAWLFNELVVTQVTTYPAAANSLQSCLTLWDPIDGSPAGSAIPGILQARVLEWDASALSYQV